MIVIRNGEVLQVKKLRKGDTVLKAKLAQRLGVPNTKKTYKKLIKLGLPYAHKGEPWEEFDNWRHIIWYGDSFCYGTAHVEVSEEVFIQAAKDFMKK